MSPLEAARRLITGQRLTHPCSYCGHTMPAHDGSCPIHSVPRVVAALEAAERLSVEGVYVPNGVEVPAATFDTFVNALKDEATA